MLIIGDEKQHTGFPWVTLLLILANAAAFLAQARLGDPLTHGYGLVPVEILRGEDLVYETPPAVREPGSGPVIHGAQLTRVPQHPGPRPIHLALATSMFLHAGLPHLVGNLAFLLAFGRNVERALGPPLFLAFYLGCGVAAGLVHVGVAPGAWSRASGRAAPSPGSSGRTFSCSRATGCGCGSGSPSSTSRPSSSWAGGCSSSWWARSTRSRRGRSPAASPTGCMSAASWPGSDPSRRCGRHSGSGTR